MIQQEKIYKRKIADEILKYLFEKEAIIIYGARQVGKTFVLRWLENFLLKKQKQTFDFSLGNPCEVLI